MVDHAFGSSGNHVVVEECLIGEEASFICFCDGTTVKPLPSSQDHKAVGEGDTGPNTGGMGAYSPAPVLPAERYDEIVITSYSIHYTKLYEPALRRGPARRQGPGRTG